MNKDTILFVFAHPDDEAYGPAGTIATLSREYNVVVVSLCDGARPGHEHVALGRREAFLQACEQLGAKSEIMDVPDCQLQLAYAITAFERLIQFYQPTIVYTHNISDIHHDHKLVAEASLVACRPKPESCINQLYFCEMPASTAWSFGQVSPTFNPNVFISVDIEVKRQVLSLYSTEVYQFPDARSIEAVEVLAKQRGYQSGLKYAEAFQLVFSRDHRN